MNQSSTNRNHRSGSSFQHPAPVGTKVRTKIERGDRYSAPEIYDLDITVMLSVRGGEARQRLNITADIEQGAGQGVEFVLVQLQIGIFSKGRGFGRSTQPYVIEKEFFDLASNNGRMLENVPVVTKELADPLTGVSLMPGKSREGWIVFQIPRTERDPLMVFKRDYRINTYGEWPVIWFCI